MAVPLAKPLSPFSNIFFILTSPSSFSFSPSTYNMYRLKKYVSFSDLVTYIPDVAGLDDCDDYTLAVLDIFSVSAYDFLFLLIQ